MRAERISLTAPVRNGRPPHAYITVPSTGDTHCAPGEVRDGVAQDHREHWGQRHRRNGQHEHHPEQSSERRDVVTVPAVPVAAVRVVRVVARGRLMLGVVYLGHVADHIPLGGIWLLSGSVTLYPNVPPVEHPLGRFGIETSEDGPDGCVASIPAGEMVNPLTGALTIAPLAMLVDHVGGLVNHHRRGDGEWTVSSELSFEVRPDAVDVIGQAPDEPVAATSRPFGAKSDVALGLCELTHRGTTLATATVRSFYISAPGAPR